MKLQKVDFHIHTNFSDGKNSVEEILDYVQNKTDIDYIAISDHDTIEGAILAKKLISSRNYRFQVIIGEEISTKEGHLLGLFLNKKISPGLSFKETIFEIKKQGGVVVAPHPFYQSSFYKDGNLIGGIGLKNVYKERNNIDAVETNNGNLIMFFSENRKAAQLNQNIVQLPSVGGSDAHVLSSIGKSYTIVFGQTLNDIKNSLTLGQTIAANDKWDLKSIIDYTIFTTPNIVYLTYFKIKYYLYEIIKKISHIYYRHFSRRNFIFNYQTEKLRNKNKYY